MFKLTWATDGKIEKEATYTSLEEVKKSEEVQRFYDFIVDSIRNGGDEDLEKIKREINECETFEELQATLEEYFDYGWTGLELEQL